MSDGLPTLLSALRWRRAGDEVITVDAPIGDPHITF